MEVKIGVQNASRELIIESSQSGEDVETAVSEALAGSTGLLVLADSRGRKVIVPTDKLAYVEVGSPVSGQVGFRS
jgi:hypothetical protein